MSFVNSMITPIGNRLRLTVLANQSWVPMYEQVCAMTNIGMAAQSCRMQPANLRYVRQRTELVAARTTMIPATHFQGVPASNIQKEMRMNWYRIEGKWEQFGDGARAPRSKLTDHQFQVISDKSESASGETRGAHGVAKDGAGRLIAFRLRADPRQVQPAELVRFVPVAAPGFQRARLQVVQFDDHRRDLAP
jgi:uncharacterized protein YjbJ (UPF0337 family)